MRRFATAADQETFVVGVGDVIEEQALVEQIERGRIVLRDDGDATGAARSTGRQTASRRAVCRGVVSRGRRDERSSTSMVGQARVLPEMEDGHLVGLHVSAIQEGSRFEEMGIEEGDVITQFNGISIGSPTEALQAAKEMLGRGRRVLRAHSPG